MTSRIAKNSLAESLSLQGGGDQKYLQLDDEGIAPIERQVAQTSQVLATVGAVTTNDPFNGSNNVVINANLAAGNSTLAITAAGANGITGMIGRTLTIAHKPTNAGGARTTLITLPAGYNYAYQGAAIPLATTSMSFPLTVASVISLTFLASGEVLVGNDATGYTFA